jgi:hypothetical protein
LFTDLELEIEKYTTSRERKSVLETQMGKEERNKT